MARHSLDILQYEAYLQAYKPRCSGCLDMNPAIFDWRAVPWASSYPSLDPKKIENAAKEQCHACALISTAFKSIGLDFETNTDIKSLALFHAGQNSSLLGLAVFDIDSRIRVELYTVQDDPPSPWNIITPKTHLSGNTASEVGLHRIRTWVRDCNMNHERCLSQSSPALPTRVLDLGDSNDSIRLAETLELSGPYICLSHCWGKTSTTLSTRENYASYQRNIPWSSLPFLFQNSVEICRLLGIRYLWIDKLCIIQHDIDDWASEGSRMAQIFEGSFLTIAAASSRDDTDSLFLKDEEYAPSLTSHAGQMEDGSLYTIYSRIPFESHPADEASLNHYFKRSPLMTRAWVYQERLLAPRVLYFGEELSWECRERSTCECSGARPGIKYDHSSTFLPGVQIEVLHAHWQKMVENFTWLQLTHDEDRLPAFSGLAQQFQHHLKSPYLAGLWKSNLSADLLWYSYPESGSGSHRYYTRRPMKWRAPSWSWASVEGPIRFSKPYRYENEEAEDSINFRIKIITAECTPSSLDPLGSVSNGRLIIKGRGRSTRLEHSEEDCDEGLTRHYELRHLDFRRSTIRSNFFVDDQPANVDYDLIERGLMRANSTMDILYLWVGSVSCTTRYLHQEQGTVASQQAYRVYGLLLHSVDGKTFERVGMQESEFQHGEEVSFHKSLEDCTITIL